ncbi:MAG TPA: hypothetical protein VFR55_09040 [Dehalococcoidia bacterium]|nr:hypothetical protein [Dehalococcoidia bacterium]
MKRVHILAAATVASLLILASVTWFAFFADTNQNQATVEASPDSIPSQDLLFRTGKLSFLRVHDVGTGFGPPTDFLNVEVVVQLAGQPGSFGFQLRNDTNRAARQGMLDLLRDAFNNDWTVIIDYNIDPPKRNGVIIRVALCKGGACP